MEPQETSGVTGAAPQSAPAPAAPTPGAEKNDLGKVLGIIGYILPILFFLPLVIDGVKSNAAARFHANQQLMLLILAIVLQFVISNILYMTAGPIAVMVNPILNLLPFVFTIIGVVNVVQNKQKALPLIGGFTLIK